MPSTSEYTRLPTTTFFPNCVWRLGVPRIRVQRMVVHGDHAEQVVVVLGDGLARPVLVDVAGLEVFEVATEGTLVNGHETEAIQRAAYPAGRVTHCADLVGERGAVRVVSTAPSTPCTTALR